MQTTTDIRLEFLSRLEDAGLSEQAIQAMMETDDPALAQEIVSLIKANGSGYKNYNLVVDYTTPVEKLIKAGKYEWVCREINSNNFEAETGQSEIDIYLLNLGVATDHKTALASINMQGYRPANLHELLSLVASYPKLEATGIAALGSCYDSGSFPCVPYFFRLESRRYLNLAWTGTGWRKNWHFAVVR